MGLLQSLPCLNTRAGMPPTEGEGEPHGTLLGSSPSIPFCASFLGPLSLVILLRLCLPRHVSRLWVFARAAPSAGTLLLWGSPRSCRPGCTGHPRRCFPCVTSTICGWDRPYIEPWAPPEWALAFHQGPRKRVITRTCSFAWLLHPLNRR